MSEQMMLLRPSELPPSGVRIRRFQLDDKRQVMTLYLMAPSHADACDCAAEAEHIGDKYFRRPQDHYWVADVHCRICGTIAIQMDDQGVAHISCLHVINDAAGQTIRASLVQVAASHARRFGCPKLILHALIEVGRAARLLHRIGFEFSRHRDNMQRPTLEFYLNLYEQPELTAGAELDSQHEDVGIALNSDQIAAPAGQIVA